MIETIKKLLESSSDDDIKIGLQLLHKEMSESAMLQFLKNTKFNRSSNSPLLYLYLDNAVYRIHARILAVSTLKTRGDVIHYMRHDLDQLITF